MFVNRYLPYRPLSSYQERRGKQITDTFDYILHHASLFRCYEDEEAGKNKENKEALVFGFQVLGFFIFNTIQVHSV